MEIFMRKRYRVLFQMDFCKSPCISLFWIVLVNVLFVHCKTFKAYIPKINTTDAANNRHRGSCFISKFLKRLIKRRIELYFIKKLECMFLHFIRIRALCYFTFLNEKIFVRINIFLQS